MTFLENNIFNKLKCIVLGVSFKKRKTYRSKNFVFWEGGQKKNEPSLHANRMDIFVDAEAAPRKAGILRVLCLLPSSGYEL